MVLKIVYGNGEKENLEKLHKISIDKGRAVLFDESNPEAHKAIDEILS